MPSCRNCGNELPEGAVYCPKCGTLVETTRQAQVGLLGREVLGLVGGRCCSRNYHGTDRKSCLVRMAWLRDSATFAVLDSVRELRIQQRRLFLVLDVDGRNLREIVGQNGHEIKSNTASR